MDLLQPTQLVPNFRPRIFQNSLEFVDPPLLDFSNLSLDGPPDIEECSITIRPGSSKPKLDPVCVAGKIVKVSSSHSLDYLVGNSKEQRIQHPLKAPAAGQIGEQNGRVRSQHGKQEKRIDRGASGNAPSRFLTPISTTDFSVSSPASNCSPSLDGEAGQLALPNIARDPDCPHSPADLSPSCAPPSAALPRASNLINKCAPPNNSPSRFNFRLRPSRRPDIVGSPSTKLRTSDRFLCPVREPTVSRERFLLSKQAPVKPFAQRRSARRGHLSDPFESPNFQFVRIRTANVAMENQSLRPPQSLRTPTTISVQLDNEQTRSRRISGNGVWRNGSLNLGYDPDNSLPYAMANVNPRLNRPRMHISKFLRSSTAEEEMEVHEKRLAVAFNIDRSHRILASPASVNAVPVRSMPTTSLCASNVSVSTRALGPAANSPLWMDNEWMRQDRAPLLEAPLLRDDFYCSVLAYSYKIDRLAVALDTRVYLWSEYTGVINTPKALEVALSRRYYVTSLAFSSEAGARAILAIGRADGQLALWSPYDEEPRFLKLRNSNAVSHLSFRPVPVKRPSQRHSSTITDNEVLLVGDELGVVSVYFVEWPETMKRFLLGWHGSICLHARIVVHTQQICGISWSANADYFATGGNDNLCCLFQSNIVLQGGEHGGIVPTVEMQRDVQGNTHMSVDLGIIATNCRIMGREKMKHQWRLKAAVKAIAFCPWQAGLVATGGGSNDRCIHFFHTMSGAALASIDCAAQVTALVWSTYRREIAATFGFPQPEHPYRVVVYSWPSCQQLLAIPWTNEMRALHAIGYPGRPNAGGKEKEGSIWNPRASDEGCLVVAASDGSIKFHEIWSDAGRVTAPRRGILGGSDILEGLHGIDKEGKESIR